MSRTCAECDSPTGPGRRVCKQCSIEDRFGTSVEIDNDDGVHCWVQDIDGEWHASMHFDGGRHACACSEVHETPVADVRHDRRTLSQINTCDDCVDFLETNEEETIPDGGEFERASQLRADGGHRCDWCGVGHPTIAQALRCCSEEFDERVNSRPMTDGGCDRSVSGTDRLGVVRNVLNSKDESVEQINHDCRNYEGDPHGPNRPVSKYNSRDKADNNEATDDISNNWLCVSNVLIGGHTPLFISTYHKHSFDSIRGIFDSDQSLLTETESDS